MNQLNEPFHRVSPLTISHSPEEQKAQLRLLSSPATWSYIVLEVSVKRHTHTQRPVSPLLCTRRFNEEEFILPGFMTDLAYIFSCTPGRSRPDASPHGAQSTATSAPLLSSVCAGMRFPVFTGGGGEDAFMNCVRESPLRACFVLTLCSDWNRHREIRLWFWCRLFSFREICFVGLSYWKSILKSKWTAVVESGLS